MNKELEQKLLQDFEAWYLSKNYPEFPPYEDIYIAGTKSDALLDYVIERAVEEAREWSHSMTVRDDWSFDNTLDEIKSIIKGEVGK